MPFILPTDSMESAVVGLEEMVFGLGVRGCAFGPLILDFLHSVASSGSELREPGLSCAGWSAEHQ